MRPVLIASLIVSLVLGLLALSGCGKKGPLDVPPRPANPKNLAAAGF